MAKNKNLIATTSHYIPTCELYSDPALNWGRKYSVHSKDSVLSELRRSLRDQTWLKGDLVECYPMTPEQVVKYHNMLIDEHKAVIAAAESEKATDREKHTRLIWEVIHLDGNRRVKKPKYLVASGNQRFSQVIDASTDRLEDVIKKGWGANGVECPLNPEDGQALTIEPKQDLQLAAEQAAIMSIPMEVIEYTSPAEQIISQLTENTMKLTGNQPPGILDIALAGREVVKLVFNDRLPSEAVLGRTLRLTKRGQIQDAWRLIAVDIYGGPELNYLARCCLKLANGDPDYANPDYINYAWRLSNNYEAKGKEISLRMIKRMDPVWVDDEVKKLKSTGRPETEWPTHLSKAEFIEYFNWRPSEEFVSTKRMGHEDMGKAAAAYGADFLKDFLDGAKNGDLEGFKAKYAGMAQAINTCCKLCTLVGAELVAMFLARINISENPTETVELFMGTLEDATEEGGPVKAENIIDTKFIGHTQPELAHAEG